MKLKQTNFLRLIIILLLFIIGACKNTEPGSMDDLDSTIQLHFEAIQNRDINSLINTISETDITLILPNGKYIKSTGEYISVNEDWFADRNWSINYEIVDKKLKNNIAIVLSKINYFDKNEDGEEYSFEYYLTLIFENIHGEWKLIFDQNTGIK